MHSYQIFRDQKDLRKDQFVHLKTNELESFSGHYWNATSSLARRIYVKNDTLRYARSKTNESKLVPISKNEFKMLNVRAEVLVKFEVNEFKQKTMAFIVNGGKPSISIEYMPIVYTKKELLQFTGSYYSTELDVYYSLKLEDQMLMLYINDTKKSSIRPIMKNLFLNDDYGIFQFNNDAKDKVSSFRLAAGRVKNLKFDKK